MNDEVSQRLDDFTFRLYRWAIVDTQRELREDFHLLRKIKSASALGHIDYVKSLPTEQQNCLAVALVKRCYQQFVTLTDEEKQLVNHFLSEHGKYYLNYANAHDQKCFALGITPQDLDKKKLTERLIENLKPICGTVIHKRTKYEWTHHMEYEGWFIDTYLEVRTLNPQIRYDHEISISSKETGYQRPFLSFMRWLGLSNTEWDLLLPGDEESAAESVMLVCSHFMKALPVLLGSQKI